MSNSQETLEALREASRQDQWQLCCEMLGKLIPDLGQIDVIRIVVGQAQRFLSDLSYAHPEDENLGGAIEALNYISSLNALDQQGKLIDSLLDKYWDLPGVSNFRNAFKGISKPQQYFGHSGEYVDTVVSLFSNMLMASCTSNYWRGNPEFSKIFFGSDVQEVVLWLAKHHSDPEQITLRASLWAELINDLDMALQAGGQL